MSVCVVTQTPSWAKLRPVLQRFAYSDWEEQHGSMWFDEIVAELSLRKLSGFRQRQCWHSCLPNL